MPHYPRILPVGEAAFTVEFGDAVDAALNRRVHALDAALAASPPPGLLEAVPTYRSLLALFDPARISAGEFAAALAQAAKALPETEALPAGRLVELPVDYGGDAGPDLDAVAAHCDLTPAEVIARHAAPVYTVAMLGFAPGFAYLLGLPPELTTPRLDTPRLRVAPGSVGIAGGQTGAYALPTPGGWRIIGRTTRALFDPARAEPFALHAGDRVRFVPVSNGARDASLSPMPNPPCQIPHAALDVLEPGLLTTVQDSGRRGWARYGVPPSGPVDAAAFRAANALVGNPPDAAGLEITLTGPVLRARQTCLVAVCGAEFELRAGRVPVPTWHAVYLRAGDCLRFGERRGGARAYLAVAGGIALPAFLGSRATYLPGEFGGLAGRALRAGDVLPMGQPLDHPTENAGRRWPAAQRPAYATHPTARVILGPQADAFTAEGLATFFSAEYVITPHADRMGMRLQGPPVAHVGATGVVSDGVVMGSIQIPPDGQPLVMLADHQTTGGYPKLATVARADLPLLAQALPGARVRFVPLNPHNL